MEGFVQLRLLSDAANSYWRYTFGLLLPSFMFIDLTYCMTLTVIGAYSLPLHIYAFFPTALLCSIVFLMHFIPLLASVMADSEAVLQNVKKSQAQLTDGDRRTLQYTKRIINAQRSFGIQLGRFCFVSLGTAQNILTESISHALVFITLVNEASG